MSCVGGHRAGTSYTGSGWVGGWVCGRGGVSKTVQCMVYWSHLQRSLLNLQRLDVLLVLLLLLGVCNHDANQLGQDYLPASKVDNARSETYVVVLAGADPASGRSAFQSVGR